MEIPHVDLNTGRISGCEKGSLKWWHEKGHLTFQEEWPNSELTLINEYLWGLWAFVISFSFIIPSLFKLGILIMFIKLAFFLYEEWWCNQYANRNYGGRK